MATTDIPVNNGVNVEALLGARVALTEAPEAAKFTWRASCEWQNGTHSRSTVEEFFGLGEEQRHRTVYSFDADHPEIFASEDNGATPVEMVLVGLASCLTAGVAAVAQKRPGAHHNNCRHRGRAERAGHEPVLDGSFGRPCAPRAQRSRQLVADRTVGFAPVAHAELAVPATRLRLRRR